MPPTFVAKLPPAPLIPAERPGVRAPLAYEAIPLLSDSAREAARAYAASPPIRARGASARWCC